MNADHLRCTNMASFALLALICLITGCQTARQDYIDLSKAEVIKKLGIPARAHPLPREALGGPGFEIWRYYQIAENSELEVKELYFGNAAHNLGRVVGYTEGIMPDKIIDAAAPEGIERIMEYDTSEANKNPDPALHLR